MLEAQLLGRQFLGLPARHRNCGRLGRAGDAQHRGVHLDLAGRELGVAHRRRAGHDLAFDEQDRFRPRGLRAGDDFRRGPSRADGDLHESVAIPEIEKHDASKVAAAVDPAPQANALSDVGGAQRAATVGPQGCPSHRCVYAPPPPAPRSASHSMR